ncbi:cell wall-binding protein [Lachnoanaerobaculum gingivalis]|uniref:Cell wall-binding protein n=1 Tax=Lachnoanaerobaculum gingivalis TaxID=2490855 RepID=A0A3P3QXH3_9FIRM|nr:MucBP domain-containing protein [Lachnoanaerobaculum gingivalis]RRJ25023.1 cell wall-binding protein [Lachnoanaerobaculum gingivalis]
MTGVLSFILALIITFTSVPIDAHATGIGSQVTTKIRYSVGGQTTSLIGKQESYSIQTGISGTVGSYTLPYSIIYLSKDKFDAPSAADVSTANFIQGVTVDNTSDAQYYKIKVTYRQLTAGPPVTFPFRAVLKNLNVAGGEQVNIKTTFHEKDGVEIVNDNKNFTAAGYVAGIEGNDNSQANPRQMGYGETIVDADVDSTHTKFSPNYQNDITFSIMNGKKNATNGEVTVKPSEGLDKRPVRVTVTLPSTSVWDASLPNNAGWTYNSADNTITKDFTRTGYEFRPLFTIKYGTATTVGRQTFPVKTVLVNTDGSTDSTTERNGSVFKDYTYVRKLKGNKYHLRYNYAVPVKEEYKHAYLITAGQYWGTTVVQNTTTTLNTIIDEPWSPNLFTGYGIRVQNGYFDAANLALIAQNKLIGVNDDGSEEVIQTNVPYEVVNNDAAMTTDSIPIAMTPKHYKSIRLEFDNEVTISKYGEKAIGLVVETQLTPAEFTKEKNRLAANPSPSSANVTNTGKVQSYSNGVWTTISSNAVYIMREEFAQMQLDKLSQKINGNTSSNIAYTGNTMEYEMNVNYDDSYIFSEDRDVENGKLVMVVDPELNFNSITVGGTPYFSADTNPTEVANYGGTGKKAYIFDLNNFAFKKQQQAIFKRDNIKVSFTPSSSLEAGEHKVEAILSWTNNTDQANSKDPHTVFSKDTANYLDIYDSNENGSTNDRLSRIEWKFNFVPPQSVIINKVEKLESEPDSAYRAKMKAEKDEIVQYRIMAYNNSNADATELNFLDIFPYAGDKNTVKDYAGNYVYRGSKFATVLQGPVTAPAGYTVYYSTDSPKGTFAENLANTWVSASGISDWSQVTMFKAIMNTGVKLAKDDKEYFTYKVKMPDTKDLDEDDTSNNSIATWYGNNIDGANEAINSKVGIYKYQVSGKAYYDVDDDGKYSTGDVLIANRPVKLLKDGNVIAETTTDANGDYTFKNIITNAGNYNVMVETLTSDTIIPNNPSTSSVIGQDFNSTESSASTLFSGQTSTWAKTDVSLTKTKTKSVKNIGLKNQTSNLTVKHIKIDDNTELIPDTTTTAGVGTPYTTAAVTTDPNYEVDTTQLPANANGTYTTTDTTVVYKYKRKNAGKVTVHHYEVGTTTELYKAPGATATGPEELDGTNKLGLSYTTQSRENDIANFELTTPAPTNPTGTFTTGEQEVIYYYKRKNAGKVVVHHYETGQTTELYTPAGKTSPEAEELDGSGKLGLPYTTQSRENDIANFELTTPAPTNASGNFTTGVQEVTYYYKRKNAGKVTVHHYEVGGTTELYTPAGKTSPAAEELDGTGKLGLPYVTTEKSADLSNYELVTPVPTNAVGTFLAGEQTVTYYYKRKNAGKVIVHHYEVGQTTELYTPAGATSPSQEELDGTRKLGLPYTTQSRENDIANFELTTPAPTNATGTFTTGVQEVTYFYKRKNAGNVVVNYLEQGTNTVLDTQETLDGTGKLGTAFTTVQKNINDYDFVSVSPAANGTFTNGTQTVNYYYKRKDAGNVLVHHVEQGTTNSLSPDENLNGAGNAGLPYTTSPANIANYTVVNATPANNTGTYPATGTIVVTYEYKRNDAGDVVVHHYIDRTTTPLVPDTTLNGTGKLGLPYTTTEHNIPNFTLVAQPANKNGNYTTGNQTVTYFYRRNDAGNVVVHHVEQGTGTTLAPDENLSGAGKSGLTYTTSPENITNFTVVNATPANNSGTYPATGTTVVTYEYKRNDAQSITVKYVEQGTGTPLDTDDVMGGTGKLGLAYTTTEKNIPNYELVAQPANKNGTYTNTPQTVIYEYRRIPAGDVTSVYVDEDGNEIDIPDTQSGTGKLGLPYTTTSKTIPKFTLVSVPPNANGTFTPGPQTVTYVYRRADAGDVTVYHKSVYDNSDLSTPTVLDGSRKLGLPYTTTPETYSDYEIDTVPSNATGTFVSGSQTVTYLYKRKQSGGVVVNYLDNHGNRIETPDTITGTDNVGLPYTTTPKVIPNYTLIVIPNNANGTFTADTITVNYIYKHDGAGDVVVEHIDENGNVPLESPEVLDGSERLGENYTTSSKVFDNYDLISVPNNATGTFTSGSQTVTYVYRRRDAGDVIAHYVNTAGIPLESDEILDGSRSLGLPYATAAKAINGYSLYLVQGAETGVFTTGRTEVTYIYKKDPSVVVIPGPLTPVTPINPSPINPINPITPVTPVNPSTPTTPTTPTTPIRVATPSQITIPGRDEDVVIRPRRPLATPSIATSSNASRGGSGSLGGNTSVRSGKATVNSNTISKNAIEKPVIVTDEPKTPQPQKAQLSKDTTKSISDTRVALSVPKTEDKNATPVYGLMLIISSALAALCIFKKRRTE